MANKAAELFLKRLQEKKRERQSGARYLNLPDKLEVHEPQVGVETFDILPYKVKSKHNKWVDAGELWFEKTYFVHYGIGVDEAAFVCPKTEGKKCPICEYRAQLLKSGDKAQIEIAKTLKPKERQLFLIYHHGEKKVKLLAMSYHLFGKLLEEEVEATGDPAVAGFWDVQKGFSLRVRWGEGSMGGGRTFTEAKRIDFVPRRHKLKVPNLSLDDLLVILDYDELKKVFFEDGAEIEYDGDDVEMPVEDVSVDDSAFEVDFDSDEVSESSPEPEAEEDDDEINIEF